MCTYLVHRVKFYIPGIPEYRNEKWPEISLAIFQNLQMNEALFHFYPHFRVFEI